MEILTLLMEFFKSFVEYMGGAFNVLDRNLGHISCRSLLTGIAFSILLSTGIYREYSWSHSNFVLKNRLAEREKDIDSLKLQVLIDEFSDTRRNACLLGSAECTNEDIGFDKAMSGDNQNERTDEFFAASFRERLSKIVASTSEALNLKVVDLEVMMKPNILDRLGYQTIFLFVVVFMNDRYRTHSSSVFPTSTPLRETTGSDQGTENSIRRQWTLSNRFFESHISRRKIVCEGVLHLAVCVLAVTARLNFIEKSLVVPFVLKFLLLWFISNYVFSFFYNLQRLHKYLPHDRVELWKSLCQSSWWLWAIPRIITSDGFRFANSVAQTNGMIEAVTCQAVIFTGELFYYYPYYYFYFYNDYFYGKNTVSEFTEYTAMRNIFLLNILIHAAIPNLLSSLCSIVALGTPKWCRKAISYVVNFNSPALHPWLITIVRVNGIVCYGGIVWYFFTGNSTNFTTIILLCLAQGITSAGNTSISNISVLSSKQQARAYLMEPFVRSFMGNHILKNAKYYEREDCEYNTEQEVVDAVSVLFVDLYEALLDKAARALVCETGKPVLPLPENVQPPTTNFMGGDIFTDTFCLTFERIYLEHFPPLHEMNAEAEKSFETDGGNVNDENENESEDKRDEKMHSGDDVNEFEVKKEKNADIEGKKVEGVNDEDTEKTNESDVNDKKKYKGEVEGKGEIEKEGMEDENDAEFDFMITPLQAARIYYEDLLGMRL